MKRTWSFHVLRLCFGARMQLQTSIIWCNCASISFRLLFYCFIYFNHFLFDMLYLSFFSVLFSPVFLFFFFSFRFRFHSVLLFFFLLLLLIWSIVSRQTAAKDQKVICIMEKEKKNNNNNNNKCKKKKL